MVARPDFSPAMIAFFLRARVAFAHAEKPARCGPGATARRELARLRKLSGLTVNQMEMAWMGRLLAPEKRAALWSVLGHFPGDHGIRLTYGGQEACHG